jgi:hypothetical protein
MAKNEPPKNIGELIDSIDLIREDAQASTVNGANGIP